LIFQGKLKFYRICLVSVISEEILFYNNPWAFGRTKNLIIEFDGLMVNNCCIHVQRWPTIQSVSSVNSF